MTPPRSLVIGASGTIGSAVVEALAARGHEIVRAARSGPETVDVSDPGSVNALLARVGPMDHLLFCAGTSRFASALELTDEDLAYTLEGKVLCQVRLVREAAASLRDGGSITLTAGVFSQRPWPGVAPAALANGALESYVRAAALDLPRGIRINAVSPPYITETASALGMSLEGTIPAARNAEAYLDFVESDKTGRIAYPAP